MKRIIVILLMLCTLLISCNTDNSATTYETEDTDEIIIEPEITKQVEINFVNNNNYTDLGVTDPMNQIIKEYFVRYYSSLGDFTDNSFDDLYYFDTEYERGITNTMVAYQNLIRRDMDIDLSFDAATVGVTYNSVEQNDTGYTVYLTQNDYMNYNFIQDITSYTSDVEHYFTLKEVEGEFFIVAHSEISSVYELIVDRYDLFLKDKKLTLANLTAAQITDTLNELNSLLVTEVNNKMELLNNERHAFNANPDSFITSVTAANEYNVEAALSYSYQWVGKNEHKRNPAFTEYDIYGGNCNNYTSQCLLNGGIPMDLYGKQWKWYGEEINNTGGRYGRSSSWAACEYFYEYCVENTGFGLVTDTNGNLFSGEPGDIIQYVSDGVGVHSVIITKVIYDDNGNVIDYLINSNTTDKIDCPMSLYGYTDFRLIKIIGYNN